MKYTTNWHKIIIFEIDQKYFDTGCHRSFQNQNLNSEQALFDLIYLMLNIIGKSKFKKVILSDGWEPKIKAFPFVPKCCTKCHQEKFKARERERERADEKEASGQPYKECYDCNLQL